jgi:hypothetical protein
MGADVPPESATKLKAQAEDKFYMYYFVLR